MSVVFRPLELPPKVEIRTTNTIGGGRVTRKEDEVSVVNEVDFLKKIEGSLVLCG